MGTSPYISPDNSDKPWIKDVTINIRAKQRQRAIIDRAAQALGKNRSDFMLETACREAESVLLDQRLFVLDDKGYAKFIAQLNAPSKTNHKLRALLETKPAWEK